MTKTKTLRANLIGGQSSAQGADRLPSHAAAGPSDPDLLYAVATAAEVARACELSSQAFEALARISTEGRARFLDRIAELLDENVSTLAAAAHIETALPIPRLTGETGRASGQLRMFSALIREGSWVDARIELGDPSRTPAPKPDIRRMLIPIGPVAVFGASNFPLAFSVAGGDTASALAAGCPVVAKAHPAHPETSQLVGNLIAQAAAETQMPEGVFSLVHGGPEVGKALVTHEAIRAVAFTGSHRAGRFLYDLAASRPTPIPVFAEMGSVNPLFALPARISEAADALAAGYAHSLTLGVGQFCTNPGVIVGIGAPFEAFLAKIAEKLSAVLPGTMLTAQIRTAFLKGCDHVPAELGAETLLSPQPNGAHASPALFRITAKQAIAHPDRVEEIFGPAAIAVVCEDETELLATAKALPGQLTATIQAADSDRDLVATLLPALTGLAGRVVFNGFPTGVEVNSAMQHGGPYPATTDSRFTSVGTGAILRFARPVAYQDVPDDVLPPELQQANPKSITRLINGRLTFA